MQTSIKCLKKRNANHIAADTERIDYRQRAFQETTYVACRVARNILQKTSLTEHVGEYSSKCDSLHQALTAWEGAY
ncbi:hypothetical protein [Methanolobus sp.]|uniref:hypothetical protein n=1 Tax=Methanolobus sp. TaxID=1874737 RepID=UPI0025E8A632|nr:hypothetical protein [Methanolobus sp.]